MGYVSLLLQNWNNHFSDLYTKTVCVVHLLSSFVVLCSLLIHCRNFHWWFFSWVTRTICLFTCLYHTWKWTDDQDKQRTRLYRETDNRQYVLRQAMDKTLQGDRQYLELHGDESFKGNEKSKKDEMGKRREGFRSSEMDSFWLLCSLGYEKDWTRLLSSNIKKRYSVE